MRRRNAGVGMEQFFVQLPPSRRLRTHEDFPEAQARQHEFAFVHHHIAGQLAPATQTFDARRRNRASQFVDARFVAALGELSLIRGLQLLDQIESAITRRMLSSFEQMFDLMQRSSDLTARLLRPASCVRR